MTRTNAKLFDNLIPVSEVAEALGMSVGSIYQWKARPEKYATPPTLFLKFGRRLYVRREVLEAWVATRSKNE